MNDFRLGLVESSKLLYKIHPPWPARLLTLGVFLAITTIGAHAGTTLTVSAQANIFGAGHQPPMDTPNPSGGSGGVPPVVYAFPANAFRALTFTNVTGTVKMGNPTAPSGPDGGNFGYRITSFNGIAGIDAPVIGYLTGVFLASNEPTDPPPPWLNFSVIGRNFTNLAPQIGQVFFIGDGLTDQGQVQEFAVPTNATRLFLGLADSRYSAGPPGYYHDNTGEFSVTVAPLPKIEPAHPASPAVPPATARQNGVERAATVYVAPATPVALAKDNAFSHPLPNGVQLSHGLEVSSDLVHWSPLTNVALYFKDLDSTNFSQRFYRFWQ